MSRYLLLSALLVALLGLIGCTPDRPFDPGTDYPEWGWDRREYTEPAVEAEPYTSIEDRDYLVRGEIRMQAIH